MADDRLAIDLDYGEAVSGPLVIDGLALHPGYLPAEKLIALLSLNINTWA
ncbi:MAG: hypothetical protein ACXWE9_05860 [Methylobacter sp.]